MDKDKEQQIEKNGNSPANPGQDRARLDAAIDQRLNDSDWSRLMATRVLAQTQPNHVNDQTQASKIQTAIVRPTSQSKRGWQVWHSVAAAALTLALLIGGLSYYNSSTGLVSDEMADANLGTEQDLMLIETPEDREVEAMLAGAVFIP